VSTASEQPVRQIVIIDDDTELLVLMSMLMRRIDAESHTFSDSSDALEYLATHTPDFIILDLMMPGIDGFQVLHQIRIKSHLDTVPVLILSAKNDPGSIRRCLDGGADGYIVKPYIASGLIDRVRLMLAVGRKAQPGSQPPA